MACGGLRHGPESLEQGTENELCSSENILNMTIDTTMILLDAPSDSERILDTADSEGSTIFLGTGKLFTFVTKVTGLWNVRHKGYAWLCVLFVLLNVLSVAAFVLIITICGPLVDRCVPPLNISETKNGSGSTETLQTIKKFVKINEVIIFGVGFASTLTLILLIFSLHKLSKKLTILSLDAAQTRVNSKEWLLINVVLIVSAVVFVGAVGANGYHIELQKMGLFSGYCLAVFINCTASLICVSVFAVVSCALVNLVSACFEEIKGVTGVTLNDIITIRQQMCQRLFIASGCFELWFVAHWVVFGAICLSTLAFNTLDFSVLRHFNPSQFYVGVDVLVMNAVFFIVPCVYASRVTWQCSDLPFKLNCERLEDWSENHPFRDRAILNEFIFYVERSRSGFRLGNFTFGSTGTWVSVFVGLIGLVLNLASFIKKNG